MNKTKNACKHKECEGLVKCKIGKGDKQKKVDKQIELQIKMIELLLNIEEEEYGCTTNYFIKHTGAEKKDIKAVIKILKRSEMVFSDWCIDDDGMLSGKAYFLTHRATQWSVREWLQELKKMQNE